MTSQAGGAFWDETTKELLGWPEVLSMLQPLSKAGQRAKRGMKPFLPHEQLLWQERMDDLRAVRAAREEEAWAKELWDVLKAVPDPGALLQLIGQGATLRQVDFFEVKQFLWQGRAMEGLLAQQGLAFSWWERLEWEELLAKLNPPGELVPTFSLAELSGDAELIRLRKELALLDEAIFADKKAQTDRIRDRYGRKPGRDGQLVFDKLDEALGTVKQDGDLTLLQETMFEAVFQVAESLAITELLQKRDAKLTEIEDQETAALQQLVEEFRPHADAMDNALEALGRLDLTLAKAALAKKWDSGWVVWTVSQAMSTDSLGVADSVSSDANALQDASALQDENALRDEKALRDENALQDAKRSWQIEGGFHPVAREAVEKRGGTFTALDFELLPGTGLITGPNMGGKTVVLKTLGLLQALAQHAMPVPARKFRFLPVERIGISGGDEQSLTSGLSSFGAEMQRIASLINAKGRALLLLDEVARTTNPEEGEALAVGLATYLLTTSHTALFASHFPGVTEVPQIQLFRVAGLKRDLLQQLLQTNAPGDVLHRLQSAMDYTLLKSRPGEVPQDAVRLATCFGLPQAVLDLTQAALQRKEGPTT